MSNETTAVEAAEQEKTIPAYDVAAIMNNFEILLKVVAGAGGRFGLRDDEKKNVNTVATNVTRFRAKYFPKG